eukprot:m.27528 g.27528  ORF g.27528 m.27528 type:complete len:248 (-) comp9367_c0_seq1:63-806(-)
MRLTADLVMNSPQFTNTLSQRELDLRENKIGVIENLGATLDQFDTIDLSDNDVRILDGFPTLKRLSTIIIANNRIARIGSGLQECLPQLSALVLTNNSIKELGDLQPLFQCKKLEHLTLLRNPLVAKEHYRLFVVFHIPSLLILDFTKVKASEREEAEKLFGGEKGQEYVKELFAKSTASLPEVVEATELQKQRDEASEKRKEAAEKIKALIDQAGSIEEMQKLEAQLQNGIVPGQQTQDQTEPTEE